VSGSDASAHALPPDPTFSPAEYERVARLLRSGVLGFLVFAGVGMVSQLVLHPSESVASLLASNPGSTYRSFGLFLGEIGSGNPEALIILGIYLMVAVTIGRVLLATADFYRGGERALGTVSATVVALLVLGLFVVGPFVH
jgi:uncharacterized membrane protein